MPWMLLNEPTRAGRAGSDERQDAAAEHGSAATVWILVGGLDRALVQAGLIGRLLETGPPPSILIASGFALANAVLLAGPRRETFEHRWEPLRSNRFLVAAAFASTRWLGPLNGMFDDLATRLAEVALMRKTRADDGPDVLAATEEGFSPLPRDSTTSSWRATIKRSLRYTSESAPLLAGAIREAATRGGRVLVLGLERTMHSHPDVDAACRSVVDAEDSVAFVTATASRKTGLLDYLLPGSGTPERLMHEGRIAAERWLAAAGQNGSIGAAQAPAGGVGGGGLLSESERGDGLWTNEASDASNWPK